MDPKESLKGTRVEPLLWIALQEPYRTLMDPFKGTLIEPLKIPLKEPLRGTLSYLTSRAQWAGSSTRLFEKIARAMARKPSLVKKVFY